MKRLFKKGDKVWSVESGFSEVEYISKRDDFPVIVEKGCAYKSDGYLYEDSQAPTLFHADEIPEYYQQFIKDDRIGKWGYFWDGDENKWCSYAKLIEVTINKDYPFRSSAGLHYNHFSLEIPDHFKD